MRYEDVLRKTVELLSEITEAEEIGAESELMEDLGIGSMDLLSLLCDLEEEFNVRLPERIILEVVSVGDMVDSICEITQTSHP